MKTSYQRELKRNYLIVETETSEEQGEPPFEQKMLEQNQIDGILRFQVRQKDEEVRFFYEITSKQPLSRLLEGQTIQAEQIREAVREKMQEAYIKYVVFDFEHTRLMDSSGIGLIAGRYREMAVRGGQVYVSHVSDSMKKVLTLSGLYRIVLPWEETITATESK